METLYQTIAIEGNIGAGKTTLATALSEELDARLLLESFESNPFLEMFYKDKARYAFQVEMFFLAERYHQLSQHLLGDIFKPSTVMDYVFTKSSIFSQFNLQEAEYELFLNLFRIMERFMPQPDIMIYLHVPAEQALKQIEQRGRSYERNIKLDYLVGIEQAYFSYMKQEKRFPIVLVEDHIQNSDPSLKGVMNWISEILNQSWPSELSYFKGIG